ncbi:hypothetical protein T05_7911 [Trichinella murrelli]|uniref:Uncharacterized protein n=1 Tax=Trichinella murrelli TaxID=144512 RepID=A0A0V0U959_9BILA|nr:hypothetical protein T05_7911 [Trichinella murrelli]
MIVGERGAANEQWLFQCDDRRRRPLKTALYRRIEDKRRHHKDKDHEYYFNKFEWLSAFERFHVPCLVELSLGFICGKLNTCEVTFIIKTFNTQGINFDT